VIGPSFSLQGDAWTDTRYYVPRSNPTYWTLDTTAGSGLHATWTSTGGTQVGILASLGTQLGSDSVGSSIAADYYDNLGVEAVYNANAVRLYGQVGLVTSLVSAKEIAPYAVLDATYFIYPNLALSANIGQAVAYPGTPSSEPDTTWGGRVEYKPDGAPVTLYAAYQGQAVNVPSYLSGSSFVAETVFQNTFYLGLRVPLGPTTVQELDKSVGLVDMNPIFGDLPR
jgi:hypothetical protein